RSESLLEGRQCAAGLHHHDLVRRRVLDDTAEAPRANDGVEALGRGAQVQLGASPDEGESFREGSRVANDLDGFVDRLGLVDDPRANSENRVSKRGGAGEGCHSRQASPETSVGWGRYGPGRSPQSLGVGKTFPGLKRLFGSKAQRTIAIVS